MVFKIENALFNMDLKYDIIFYDVYPSIINPLLGIVYYKFYYKWTKTWSRQN